MNRLIFPLLLFLALSCGKDDQVIAKENPDPLIEFGCIPERIIVDMEPVGLSVDEYIYQNNRLIRYGINTVEYENGLVSRINLGSNRYEEYLYDEQCQVIRATQYRRDSMEEGFMIVNESELSYENNNVIQVFDNVESELKTYTYYPGSTNIETIKTYDSNMELLDSARFEYDSFNNPLKNLNSPRFGYCFWLERSTANNIIHKTWTNYRESIIYDSPYTVESEYTLEYNEFDFPIEILVHNLFLDRESRTVIEYRNCN